MKLLVTLILLVAFLVAVGCAEPEEDWRPAETYLDCFFDAYQPYLDNQTEKNDEAISEAVIHARKQCHVPSRGALKAAETGRGTDALRTCLLRAEELIETRHGEQIDLTKLQAGWVPMLQLNVCQPNRTDRINSHLDGSEAG